jgi:NADP-dependent 3-hydroxy acid dehydrogenase YdfG
MILTTGNPTIGLASAISSEIGGDFISRTNGYDLCSDDGRKRAVAHSLNYDVFINCAALWRFNQTLLLQAVWEGWKQAGKSGRIVNIGSTADTGNRGTSWIYPTEKKALREYSRNLSMASAGGSGIQVNYVSFGYLSTPSVEIKHPDKNKMALVEAAGYIKWIIKQPMLANFNELSMDPIQTP